MENGREVKERIRERGVQINAKKEREEGRKKQEEERIVGKEREEGMIEKKRRNPKELRILRK